MLSHACYGDFVHTSIITNITQPVHSHHEEQRPKCEYDLNKHVRLNPYQHGDLVWMDDPTKK